MQAQEAGVVQIIRAVIWRAGPVPGFPARKRAGFTIIEMLAAMAILGLLAGISIPRLHATMNAANVAKAIGDIEAIQTDLESIEAGGTPLPVDLAAIGRGNL